MNPASATGGLIRLKGAKLQTPARIGEKGRALITERFARPVMVSAITSDHQLHGFCLAAHPSCW